MLIFSSVFFNADSKSEVRSFWSPLFFELKGKYPKNGEKHNDSLRQWGDPWETEVFGWREGI